MEEKRRQIDPEELIPGYFKDELTLREVDELLEWIKSGKENKRRFDEYSEIWLMAQHLSNKSEFDAANGFSYFKERVKKEEDGGNVRGKHIFIVLARYAAVAALFLVLGALSYRYFRDEVVPVFGEEQTFSELVVPYGGNAKYTMTDGTVVNLNAGSKLRFGSGYGKTDRNVDLIGEGYFEVSKNELLPFNVVTSHLTVTALGTAFNVKAYENDPIIEATLVEGSIKIDKKNSEKGDEPIFLEPNQKLTLVKSESALTEVGNTRAPGNGSIPPVDVSPVVLPNVQICSVDVEPVIAWKDNRWIFENQTLSLIAVEMERRYDVEIKIETERLKNTKFTGTVITEPIEQVLEALSLVIPIDFEVEGKMVTITEHESFDKMINRKLYNSY